MSDPATARRRDEDSLHALHALIPFIVAPLLLGAPATHEAPPDGPEVESAPASLPPPATAAPSLRWMGARASFDRIADAAERAALERRPLAIGWLYRAWNMHRLLDQAERMRALVDAITRSPKVDPFVAAHARYLASSLDVRRGDLDRAKRTIRELGIATEAMILGPFENSAAQGHFEPYPPELEIALDKTVPGKGHPIGWRSIQGLADLGTFELSSLVSPSEDATVYVLVVLESERAVDGALRVGSTDQLKVFLDGAEIFAQDTRRSAALDQDAIPLALRKGRSVLLLKSSWTGNLGRLVFRLTRPDGAPLEGVRILGDAPTVAETLRTGRPSTALARRHAVDTVSSALDRFIARGGRAPAGELATALALRSDLASVLSTFDRRKLPTPPERDLARAIQLAPGDPSLRFFFAHRIEERDPALAREELEAALVADPGHAPSLYKLGEMAKSAGRVLEARAAFERAIAQDPLFAPAIVALADLRFDAGADRELAALDLAKQAENSPYAALHAELARFRRDLEDRRGAEAAAEKALALDASDGLTRSLLIGLLLEGNAREKALALLDTAIAHEPWSFGHRTRKARVLAGIPGRAEEALAQAREAARLFPDETEPLVLAAELELFRGGKDSALVALDRALGIDPFQPDVRKHYDALKGERDGIEDTFSVAVEALTQAPVSEEEKSYGAIYLADRTAIRLYENGQSSRFVQTVLRLRNPNLKDALRVHRVGYSPSREVLEVLTAERVRKNGEVLKANSISESGSEGKVGGMYVDRRTKSIVFDDLAEGDLVHIRYRIDSVGQNMFGTFFGDMEPLQGGLPKLGVLYTVIGPKSRRLEYGLMRVPAPKVENDAETTRLTWSLDQVDALENEPFSPPYPEIGMMVNVSTYERWEDLGKWYAGLFADQLELDAAARAAGRKVVAGAKDDLEKIRRLYDYVVKNTRYVGIELGIHGWKPFKASEVHRRRYGDCKDKATLLAALLRDNGIEATLALVRTADRGQIEPRPATMWAFNHAITYVPSHDLFLDGTAEFSGSGELPWMDQGAMALIVHPDGRTKLASPAESQPRDNLNESSYVAKLGRGGAIELTGRETFYGARASQTRQEFEEVGERRSRLEKQLNQVFEGVRVEKLEFSDLSNLEAPVVYDYEAAIPRYGVEDQGRLLIPLTLFHHQVASVYATNAERKYGLFSNHAWATRNVVRYEIPASARLESLPEGVTLDTKHISLVQKVRAVPGGFETDDTVTVKTRRIPAEDYAEFREACLAIDRALGRTVVIRW